MDYLNQSRPLRDAYEQKEAEGLEAFFLTQNWPEGDLMLERMRKHPTFFLMCHWKNHFELKSLQRFPEIQGRILDVGCGSGHLTVLAAQEGYKIDGLDKLDSAISVGEYLATRENVSVNFHKADLCEHDYSWIDPDFDSGWLSHIVEHIEDPTFFFKNLRHLVKGNLLVSVPLANAYPDPDHKHRWDTKEEFVAYISKWLNVVRGETDTENGCIRALCTFKD